jgi:hypothetical protein
MSILGHVPIWFEPNKGQFPQASEFAARSQNYSLYLLDSAVVLKPLQRIEQGAHSRPKTVPRESSGATLLFVGSNRNPAVAGRGKLHSVSNYFRGSDPRNWLTKIAHYSSVEYRNVYPGIDLICRSRQTEPEFDWIVRPGADPAQIRLSVYGGNPSIDRLGNLALKLPEGEAQLKKPTIYQEFGRNRHSVSGEFTLEENNQIAFQIGHWDRTRPLIIDPVLVYSTYLGGSTDDEAAQVSVDGSGNIYVIGTAQSDDFPLVNPLQSNKTGFLEAFISKFDASGSNLVYSTYLGGTAPGHVDSGNAIVVDQAGNAYITGQTNDLNFPTTPGAYLPAPGGGVGTGSTDGWAAKLDPTGSSLIYSTYLTGNGNNVSSTPSGIALDAAGDVYLTGAGSCTGLITPGAYSTPSLPGGLRAFITKLNSNGSALVYSSCFGGNANDQPFAIAIDPSDNAYITGFTMSTDFPETTVLQSQGAASLQAFVVKLNVSGNQLMYSTLFGSGQGFGIAVDASGNAYVTGYADSYLFPTAGPMQGGCQGNNAFVSKINPSGTTLAYSICLAGSVEGYGIAVDSNDNAYITGRTQSTGLPAINAIQPIYGGGTLCGYNCSDAFVTEVSADGSKFLFSTYLGDIGFESGNGIAVDPSGSIYVTGATSSLDFPLANPYQAVQNGDVANGGANAFVAKIAADVSITPQRLVFGPAPLGTLQRQGLGVASAPQSLTFTNNTSSSITFGSDTFAGINPSEFTAANDNCAGSAVPASGSCGIAVVFTPAASGIRQANLQLNNSADNSPFIVSLIGYGSPVTFAPATLDFGLQTPGTTSAPQSLSVTNRGTAALTIDSLSPGGYNPQFFPIQADGCTGTTLNSNGSCSITFTFSPPNIGQFSTILAVNDTASDSPQSVLISGVGIGPQAAFSNGSLEFANQPVGTTSPPQPVTLNNVGTAPLIITSIATTLSDFSQTNNCGSQIAAAGSCTIQVSFTPAANGILSGGLQVSDDAPGSPQQVNLNGTGGAGNDFAISVSPPSSTVTDGNSASFNISVSPVDGAFDSAVSLGCSSLPQGTSCAFSATSVTPGTSSAQAQLTISTTAAGMSVHDERFRMLSLPVAPIVAVLLCAWVFATCYYKGSRRVVARCALFVGLCFLSSCGGGSGESTTPPSGTLPGTPSGTYSITVTGTSGSLAHSQSVSLTVQ